MCKKQTYIILDMINQPTSEGLVSFKSTTSDPFLCFYFVGLEGSVRWLLALLLVLLYSRLFCVLLGTFCVYLSLSRSFTSRILLLIT